MKLLAVLLTTAILPFSLPIFAAPADDVANNASYRDGYEQMLAKYRKYVKDILASRGPQAKCNSKNVLVRKEWGSMKKQDRIEYIKAVKCFYSKKPPLSLPRDVPGARNRFDDFQAAHIQRALNIHLNGYFFAWHRHLIWLYDRALRNECGYRGPTPYWDWTLYPDDPGRSPVFDGSDSSMGGNGEYYPHGPILATGLGTFLIPAGTGGGCVKGGPFTDHTVNLGLNLIILPIGGNQTSVPVPPEYARQNETGLAYNPRCVRRDLNPFYNTKTRRSDIEHLLNCPTGLCFLQRADGWEPDVNPTPQNGPGDHPGPHSSGHYGIGGLQTDPFASPGDPVFYLHHAQVDRVWALWQAQDPNVRTYEVAGPKTPGNIPPSDPVQPDDPLEFGVLGNTIRLRDALSTIDGPYCYIYE